MDMYDESVVKKTSGKRANQPKGGGYMQDSVILTLSPPHVLVDDGWPRTESVPTPAGSARSPDHDGQGGSGVPVDSGPAVRPSRNTGWPPRCEALALVRHVMAHPNVLDLYLRESEA
jgi:hypothetical protein